ncbi:amidase [Ideonella sp. B7]|uniref:amidase n=1 Tax=Ideonella benzenivorans TaxID=2831643 RepID=UPI001CEC0849|nr:amidase [Ideonella benzenivorans]MCA6215382.1 amidase [Ideonella benzenivorans]
MQRRTLLLSSASSLGLAAAGTVQAGAWGTSPPAGGATATALAAQLAAGRLRSEDLVRDSLQRIKAIDRQGPQLHSVIELNPEALDIARALDAERARNRLHGPLHGLPVLLKDNIATGDRMSTSAGSLALDGVRATRDAHLVQRLRAAGAVILGKTNLSEWANIRSTRATSGWSGRGGLTRNPYALDRNTSGSSAGTAAALAAELAPLGVGTETDGSIVSPASICGLVGLKPTVGRISRDGIIPISHTQDTAGPMTRSVADAALLYKVLAGRDPADAATERAPASQAGDGQFRPQALRGARLGVARTYFTGFDEADALIDRMITVLQAQGAEVIDPVDLPPTTPYNDAELDVMLYELKHDLAAWLASFAPQAPVKNLADVIAFNQAHRAQEMPWFGQELFERAQALGGLDTPAYRAALALCGRLAREEGLDKVFRAHRLDALVAPTGGLAWLTDPIAGDHALAGFSTPAAVAGYPHLTVPAGLVRGLPLGLSFVGPAWSEWTLLSLGLHFEQVTQARQPPRFTPRTVPL